MLASHKMSDFFVLCHSWLLGLIPPKTTTQFQVKRVPLHPFPISLCENK